MSKLLLVDSESDILEVYSTYLKQKFSDLEIITANSAFEAIKLFDHSITHLITELEFPGIRGLDLIWKIRDLKPNVGIFAHTGNWDYKSTLSSLLVLNKIQGYAFKPHKLELLYDFMDLD